MFFSPKDLQPSENVAQPARYPKKSPLVYIIKLSPHDDPVNSQKFRILFKSQGAKVERASLPVCRFFFFK
jgi:hypothetical protein